MYCFYLPQIFENGLLLLLETNMLWFCWERFLNCRVFRIVDFFLHDRWSGCLSAHCRQVAFLVENTLECQSLVDRVITVLVCDHLHL